MKQIESGVEIMMAAGLEDEQILKLAIVKHEVEVGERDDLTIEYKRMMFLKYLSETEKIGG